MESNLGLGAGSTSEMIIQTPSDDGGTSSILTAEALLSHLEILQKASKVVVEQDDVYVFPVYQADFSRVNFFSFFYRAWTLKDLCNAQTIPISEVQMINKVSFFSFPIR